MKKIPPSFLIFAGIFVMTTLILSVATVSAGLADWFNSITGRATSQNIVLNVTVSSSGAPQITNILQWNRTASYTFDPTEAGATYAVINFTAYSPNGYANLLDSTARLNITLSGVTRTNTTCVRYQQAGNYANYSCTVDLWYFDTNNDWNITASINDSSNTNAQNVSANITFRQLTAIRSGPSPVTFAAIAPGATNATSNNKPYLVNNTGNAAIVGANMKINATNLRGEANNKYAIWAGNMSVGNQTGSNAECGNPNSTVMSPSVYTAIGTVLSVGNNTLNDGTTGQRNLYTCIRLAGNELSPQAYSTANESAWTIKVQ